MGFFLTPSPFFFPTTSTPSSPKFNLDRDWYGPPPVNPVFGFSFRLWGHPFPASLPPLPSREFKEALLFCHKLVGSSSFRDLVLFGNASIPFPSLRFQNLRRTHCLNHFPFCEKTNNSFRFAFFQSRRLVVLSANPSLTRSQLPALLGPLSPLARFQAASGVCLVV